MADEMVGMTGSFSIDTSSLDASAARVAGAAEKITRALRETKAATDQTTAATNQIVPAFGSLTGGANAWSKAVQEGNQNTNAFIASQKAYEKSLVETLVPIQKLQVEGLKYQDTLRKNAAAAEAAATRQAAADAKINDRRMASGGNFVSLELLQMQAIKYSQAAGQAGGASSNLAARLMVLGQVADDAQYGFRAIVNQIPMAVMAFGGSMGLAGGVALAGVAINQLLNRWDSLAAAFGSPVVKTMAEQMEDLAKKTNKTSEEIRTLETYERRRQTTSGQEKRRPKAETAVNSEVAEFIGEQPFESLKQTVIRALQDDFAKVTDRDVENAATLGGMAAFGRNAATDVAAQRARDRQRLEAERNQQIEKRAIELLADAETGVGVVGAEARKQLAKQLAGTPEGGFFERQTPEERKRLEDQRRNLQQLADAEEFDIAEGARKRSKELEEQDIAAAIAPQQQKEAADRVKEIQEANAIRMQQNEDRNEAFFREPQLQERDSDLQLRLRGLMMRGATQSNSFGDLDSYEASIKATSEEQQLRKMHDIHEVLKQIRANTGERQKIAQRLAR